MYWGDGESLLSQGQDNGLCSIRVLIKTQIPIFADCTTSARGLGQSWVGEDSVTELGTEHPPA